MKVPLGLGIRIWITAVFINSVLFSFYGLISEDGPMFVVGFLVGILGVILTFPYIVPVRFFIGVASKLPFSYKAKLVWVAWVLGLFSSSFYLFFSSSFGWDPFMFKCVGITAAAVILAVAFHSKKILLFFEEQEYQVKNDLSIRNQHPLQNGESVSL